MQYGTNTEIVDIATVSGSRQTRYNVNRQLKQYLPSHASLVSYSFEEGIPEIIRARVLLLTGESFEKRMQDLGAVWEESHIVVAKRTIDPDSISRLLSLKDIKTVLLVNDSAASAEDAIRDLQSLGFLNWNYIPYSPETEKELPADTDISCVLSVGEPDLVPENAGPVCEIGTRIISVDTIAEVWSILGWSMEVVADYMKKYMERLISMTQRVYESREQVDFINRNLGTIIDSIDDGMLVFDRSNERISVFNNQLKKLSGISGNVIGKTLMQAVGEPEIRRMLTEEEDESEQLIEWNGRKMMLSRISADANREICIFRSVDTIRTENSRLNSELVKQGFYAKYSFDDIMGISAEIRETKERALKLAQTELNVLIEGESGTGKELFAAAIHSASARRNKPYLAINFSSLNDSLLESELFGYEGGSFTGACRGGRAGVFEMADGGTIFLDEIGDISPKMQAGLLRVLQEKEVRRIGDGRIRSVDVRIIAATNQNLLEKVRNGLFREDLYYRLKIGCLRIPPLRDRAGDVRFLAQKLLAQSYGKGVVLTPSLLQWMERQSWNGNVRELKNLITYMEAMRTDDVLDLKDLPESEKEHTAALFEDNADEELYALIRELSEKNSLLGRRILLEESQKRGICSTEYQLRKRLKYLEERGLVLMGKGKVGIQLR